MGFLLRSVRESDAQDLRVLSSQFTLINLPNDPQIIEGKIHRSRSSFSGALPKEESEYLFVVEDIETERTVGSSMVLAKHGTPEAPHFYFQVSKKEKFSRDLGVGFVHQTLQLKEEVDGPTEIGGLLVSSDYRRRSEKVGKQISLVRFLYMAMFREKFESRLLCELSPPNMAQGKSEFWEALGRRFTGLPYQEADRLSHRYKEFIRSLFPTEEIYTCLLSSSARFALGRVGEETRPAQHLLEKLGFRYLNEVDPFDGGPHYGCETGEVSLIQKALNPEVCFAPTGDFQELGVVGYQRESEFFAMQTRYSFKDGQVVLPESIQRDLRIEGGEDIWVAPVV